MSSQGLNRRQMLAGVCGAALAVAGQPAGAAGVLRVTVRWVGEFVRAVGKPIRVSVAIAVDVGNFVWSGMVGTFNLIIGQTRSFTRYVAGMVVQVTIKTTTSYARVTTKAAGAFGTITRTVIKNF